MSAHTPGPWQVCAKAPNDHWFTGRTISQAGHGGRRVADVMGFDCPQDMGTPHEDSTCAANARLIAAAPALVEALQEAAEYIDDHVDVVDGAYGYQVPNRAMSLMNRINEALRAAGVE